MSGGRRGPLGKAKGVQYAYVDMLGRLRNVAQTPVAATSEAEPAQGDEPDATSEGEATEGGEPAAKKLKREKKDLSAHWRQHFVNEERKNDAGATITVAVCTVCTERYKTRLELKDVTDTLKKQAQEARRARADIQRQASRG